MDQLVKNDNRSQIEIEENKKTIARRIAKMKGTSIVCEVCNNHFLKSEIKSTDDFEHICFECINKGKCDSCGEYFLKDDLNPLEDINGEVTYENLCEECEEVIRCEDEPNATVYYGDDEQPYTIGCYHDDTEGDFSVSWHSSDAWRGYYSVIASDDWEHVHDDCILSYSYDAEQLEEFDKKFRKILNERGIKFARVFSRTSNVFSTGYDFFVEKGKTTEALAIKTLLALKYRNPDVFKKNCSNWEKPFRLG